MAKKTPLQEACEIVGGPAELADKLGLKFSQNVYNWLRRKNGIPPQWCVPVEQATGGRVTRYELRPDVFRPDAAA